MGRPKIKIIDDSMPEEENRKQKPSKQEAKLESVEATSSVIPNDSEESQDLEPRDSSQAKPDQNDKIEEKTEAPKEKKAQKPGKRTKVRSKKYQELTKDLDKSKSYPLTEAVDLVKKLNYGKFDGTLEAHINTVQTGLRGLVSLPFASGKKLRILVFGKDSETTGADIFGSDEVIEEINKGKVSFDLVVTTPEWMPKLAKIARILGPRGLMPNPKNGTITQDLKKAVEGFQAGKTEYKTEPKAAVIHIGLGKLKQPTEQLSANIKTLIQTVGKTRVKKVTLSPTMGPSVKVELSSL